MIITDIASLPGKIEQRANRVAEVLPGMALCAGAIQLGFDVFGPHRGNRALEHLGEVAHRTPVASQWTTVNPS